MTTPLSFDLYWSFRSPYSYLLAQRLINVRADYEIDVNVRIVRPLAVRQPEFFEERDPRWLHYTLTDVMREAQRFEIPIALPNPDPIIQNMETREIAAEQPFIYGLNRLGSLACEEGDGLAYIAAASLRIMGGAAAGHDAPWTEAGELDGAAKAAGLDPTWLQAESEKQAERLDAQVIENEAAHNQAGHWGVPLMVFNNEPFFGQDRLDSLIWRMQQAGLKTRAQG